MGSGLRRPGGPRQRPTSRRPQPDSASESVITGISRKSIRASTFNHTGEAKDEEPEARAQQKFPLKRKTAEYDAGRDLSAGGGGDEA
jgi:hypothetical protein